MSTSPQGDHPAQRLSLPERDRSRAARTGLTRAHWETVAEDLLLALRPWAGEDGALILPPGRPSSNGTRSDGLEGFARSFLLAALLLTGRDGDDPQGHAGRYADGLAAGVDPRSPSAWPRPGSCPQAKVEAASIALALDLTRPWIWDRADPATREHTISWLREVIGTDYPPINWVWFRIVVLTFLRDVDPRCDPEHGDADDVAALRTDLARDLAVHESCARAGGWFSDGPERAYDHYGTWAFAVFPTLWLRMRGADALRADGLITAADEDLHRQRLAAFIEDALGLIGADGGPLIQGRSLIYRMAAAAPAWAAALAGLADGPHPRVAPGRLRRAASGILDHFLSHGVPDEDGLLTLGWFDAFPPMAQSYSGPGSPYWAAKGFLGLILPADHPVWTADEEPLPVEDDDSVQVLEAPGWIVSRTRADGIVRIINHGTDHALPGQLRTDAPLYARFGYSTATSPPMAGPGVEDPRDGTVAVLHPELGWSHRTGFETLRLRQVDERTAVGVSRQHCHWVRAEHPDHDHGSGRRGAVTRGPVLTVGSIVRAGTEVRIVRAETDVDLPLAIAGWALSGPGPIRDLPAVPDGGEPGEAATGSPARSGRDAVAVSAPRHEGGELVSSLTPLRGPLAPHIHRQHQVSPLGDEFAVPQVQADGLRAGESVAVAVHLGGAQADPATVVEETEGYVVVRFGTGPSIDLPLR